MADENSIADTAAANPMGLRKGRQSAFNRWTTDSGVSEGMVVQIEKSRTTASSARPCRLRQPRLFSGERQKRSAYANRAGVPPV